MFTFGSAMSFAQKNAMRDQCNYIVFLNKEEVWSYGTEAWAKSCERSKKIIDDSVVAFFIKPDGTFERMWDHRNIQTNSKPKPNTKKDTELEHLIRIAKACARKDNCPYFVRLKGNSTHYDYGKEEFYLNDKIGRSYLADSELVWKVTTEGYTVLVKDKNMNFDITGVEDARIGDHKKPHVKKEPQIELWWQTRDRKQKEMREEIIALRNDIRQIHGC